MANNVPTRWVRKVISFLGLNKMPSIVGAASEKHKQQMEKLADALGLLVVEYKDHGNKEEYLLTGRKMETISIMACGNGTDGGFLVVREPK